MPEPTESHTVTLTLDEMQRFLDVLDNWHAGNMEEMVGNLRHWTRNMEDRQVASILRVEEAGMHTTLDELLEAERE